MYLTYNLKGKLKMQTGNEPILWGQEELEQEWINFEDVHVNQTYLNELKSLVNPVRFTPAFLLIFRLLLTFLLSDGGQAFFKNVLNWFYRILLKRQINKFVKKYKNHIFSITDMSVDNLKETLYNEVVYLLTYELSDTKKNILVKSFNGEL